MEAMSDSAIPLGAIIFAAISRTVWIKLMGMWAICIAVHYKFNWMHRKDITVCICAYAYLFYQQ